MSKAKKDAVRREIMALYDQVGTWQAVADWFAERGVVYARSHFRNIAAGARSAPPDVASAVGHGPRARFRVALEADTSEDALKLAVMLDKFGSRRDLAAGLLDGSVILARVVPVGRRSPHISDSLAMRIDSVAGTRRSDAETTFKPFGFTDKNGSDA